MTVNIVPYTLPPRRNRKHVLRRPWNIDPSCVLALMPEVNTQWIDYSGKGNDGTIVGATKIYNGRFGEGLLFDGINDIVNCGDDASMKPVDAITLEAWVYKNQLITNQVFIGNFGGAGNQAFILYSWSGDPSFTMSLIADDLSVAEVWSTEIEANRWYHVVGTYDKANLIIYVNGIVNDSAAFSETLDDTTADIIIGNTAGDYGTFDGMMDEVRIYNRALKAWEIRALYEQGRP